MSRILYFLIFTLFFISCGTTKRTATRVETRSMKYLLERFEEQQNNYSWYSSKMKVAFKTGNNSMRVSAYLKMRSDSLIWVSISPGFGFEAMRIQITKDSIYVLHRLNKEFTRLPFSYINNYFPVKELSFNNLENLLLGNPFFLPDEDYVLQYDTNSIVLRNSYGGMDEELSVVPDIYKTKSFLLERPANRQKVFVNYDGYQKFENIFVPEFIGIEALSPEPVNLELEVGRINFSKREIVNFEVPGSYNKVILDK